MLLLLLLAGATACMKWDYGNEESFHLSRRGLFITNEGNFQYGNATLSYYDPDNKTVENELFYRANAMKLGDVAQSMTIRDGIGWIVVNNSHVIFAIDIETGKEIGRITNLTSPRYMHFLSDEKAYVTQIWDNKIFIVNPSTFEITGRFATNYGSEVTDVETRNCRMTSLEWFIRENILHTVKDTRLITLSLFLLFFKRLFPCALLKGT